MTSKTQNIKAHAKRRFRERLGKDANQEMMKEIAGMIKNGRSEPIKKQSNRVSKHRVTYQGIALVVVYDKRRGLVVTLWKDGEKPNAL